MSSIVHGYIEDYIRGLIQQRDEILLDLEDYAAKNSVPIIHKEVGQLLKILIKCNGVKNILEVGTAIGYSAILMAKASVDCKITSIERDEKMLSIALENINKANLKNRIEIIFGEAGDILPKLEGKFDLIFLDAAKGHYIHFLPDCIRLLKDGGLLVSDNVLFRGMIATNELVKRRKITIVKRLRKYLDVISNRPDLDTVVLPIGDGLAISLKLKEV